MFLYFLIRNENITRPEDKTRGHLFPSQGVCVCVSVCVYVCMCVGKRMYVCEYVFVHVYAL